MFDPKHVEALKSMLTELEDYATDEGASVRVKRALTHYRAAVEAVAADDKVKITTDLIVAAARVTRDVYVRNARKLIGKQEYSESALAELKRATYMDALMHDDNLCEMLAGRIHQLGHGVK